jgi:putative methyltransferase (TIGR04325 family)
MTSYIYHIRQERYRRAFLTGQSPRLWGRFRSAAEANALLPPHLRSTYDNSDLTNINADSFATLHLFDWPILFHFERLLHDGNLNCVTDFGGHVGVKYYAYRERLRFPDSCTWQVVDVPAMVEAGRRHSLTMDASHLTFSACLNRTLPCDFLFCSGVLQYVDETIAEIIGQLPEKPRTIAINKLPVIDADGFFTLENFGKVKIAYQIFNAAEHQDLMRHSGYTLRDRWHIPFRDFNIPFVYEDRKVQLVGEIWERR